MLPATLQLDLLQLAANISYAGFIFSLVPNNTVQLISYDERFPALVGGNVSSKLTAQRDYEFVYAAILLRRNLSY